MVYAWFCTEKQFAVATFVNLTYTYRTLSIEYMANMPKPDISRYMACTSSCVFHLRPPKKYTFAWIEHIKKIAKSNTFPDDLFWKYPHTLPFAVHH
jgi:hypothetical protein